MSSNLQAPKHLTFCLKIQKLETQYSFNLSWGDVPGISTIFNYPKSLIQTYQRWQGSYLYFYKTQLRGKSLGGGGLPPADPYKNLCESEDQLLNEFKKWLNQNEMFITTIRQEIAKESPQVVDLLLTCSTVELNFLPWEYLETIIATPVGIRIVRNPVNIRKEKARPRRDFRRGCARILAIFGDSTGINLEKDKKTLASLSTLTEIKWLVWQEGKDIQQHRKEIIQALEDERGWDILLFAGHSQENSQTGGELSIAPKQTILLKDIENQLEKAKNKGLQFALFNSCTGLDIASYLIDLGLHQVAIMREPIHNQVAGEFLVEFLKSLANYNNVYTALKQARTYLENHQTNYPSAYLVPSLFYYPGTEFFQLQPQANIQRWLPTGKQGIVLGILIFLSLFSTFQNLSLNYRLLIQAFYRDLTSQLPPAKTPPVLLVEIDEESLQKANIHERYPIDRKYLARLIDKLVTENAKIIGLDYLLDLPQVNNDPIFAKTIKKAVQDKQVWFVFAAIEQEKQEKGVAPNLASLSWSLQGSSQVNINYLRLPEKCSQLCPFAYLLALVHNLTQQKVLLHPKLEYQGNLRTELLKNNLTKPQKWFSPINDFSLPPQSLYESIPAWQLLQENSEKFNLNRQIVLIASGGYREAGINNQNDYFPLPLAVEYWLTKSNIKIPSNFPGGQVNSYMIGQWSMGHWVSSIPDVYIVIIGAFFGQGISLSSFKISNYKGYILLIVGIGIYGLLSLQLYISASILIPWLLPSITLILYPLPYWKK